jgi:hypothetical protein
VKYKDLPIQDAILRLTSYAFVRDNADESVFKFYRSISPAYEFYGNQRSKIVMQYGDKQADGSYLVKEDCKEEYARRQLELIESDVSFVVEELDLTEDDFCSGKCRKPSDVSLLLSSSEKEAILRLSDIIRKEHKIAKLNEVKNELESSTAP